VKRAARPAVAAALASALAVACGGTTGQAGDGSAADAPVDASADAPTDTNADAAEASTCPAMIAACAQALDAIQATCPVGDLTCVEQQDPSGGLNDCYPNGVRIYYDQTASDTVTITVVGADGRVCYTVDHNTNADNLITDTVDDPSGRRVIAKIYRLSWDHTTYACSTGQVDIPDSETPCGHPINVIPLSTCVGGTCQRL